MMSLWIPMGGAEGPLAIRAKKFGNDGDSFLTFFTFLFHLFPLNKKKMIPLRSFLFIVARVWVCAWVSESTLSISVQKNKKWCFLSLSLCRSQTTPRFENVSQCVPSSSRDWSWEPQTRIWRMFVSFLVFWIWMDGTMYRVCRLPETDVELAVGISYIFMDPLHGVCQFCNSTFFLCLEWNVILFCHGCEFLVIGLNPSHSYIVPSRSLPFFHVVQAMVRYSFIAASISVWSLSPYVSVASSFVFYSWINSIVTTISFETINDNNTGTSRRLCDLLPSFCSERISILF